MTYTFDALDLSVAAGGPTVSPSRLARLLFAELLFRRVGRDAALTWLGPQEPWISDVVRIGAGV